jgi:5-methyltetrahydrofolate--homocysteine methyltransferase
MTLIDRLRELLAHRIVLLDGGIGTMFPDEFDKDALVLTDPDRVSHVHEAYLDAGADIIRTNTFRSTASAQAPHGLAGRIYDLNVAGARLARAAADGWSRRTPDRRRFVAGVIGPVRHATFGATRGEYRDAARGLLDGRVDLLLIETIVDTMSARAAIAAIRGEPSGEHIPLLLSATVDRSGRLLSGETLDAFVGTATGAGAFSVGLNCAHGAREIRPHLAALAGLARGAVSCHPNAGLPDALGRYAEDPHDSAATLRVYAEQGLVNIVGGCCGTTPAHTRALAAAVADVTPRRW